MASEHQLKQSFKYLDDVKQIMIMLNSYKPEYQKRILELVCEELDIHPEI